MRAVIGLLMYFIATIWLLLGTMYALGALTWATDREVYEEIAATDAIYDAIYAADLPQYFSDNVVDLDVSGDNNGSGLTAVEEANGQAFTAMATALREVVPRDYLQSEAERLVGEVFDFLESEAQVQTLTLAVEMGPVIDNFNDDERTRAFANQLADNLPDCVEGMETDFDGSGIPACIQEGMTPAGAVDQTLTALPSYVQSIDAQLVIVDEEIDKGFEGSLQDAIVPVAFGLICVCVGAWVLNSVIGGGGSRRGILLWLGGTLLLPAVAVTMTGVSLTSNPFQDQVDSSINDVSFSDIEGSPELRAALSDVAGDVMERAGQGFLTTGGIALAVAVLFGIFGMMTPRPSSMAGPMVSIPSAPGGGGGYAQQPQSFPPPSPDYDDKPKRDSSPFDN